MFSNCSESLANLFSISLCSKRFYALATLTLYKDFYLSQYIFDDLELDASIAALNGLVENGNGSVQYVETFTVSGIGVSGEWEPEQRPGAMRIVWLKIAAALENIPRLKMFK